MSLPHPTQPGHELPYPSRPGDVDHLVLDDHLVVRRLFQHLEQGRGDRRTLADQVSYHLAVLAAAEEAVLYPEMKAVGDADLARHGLDEDREIKECLAVMEGAEPGSEAFEAALARVIAEVGEHAAEEENLWLGRLRSAVGPERMAQLGEKFVHLKRTAPGHVHPSAPDTPPANKVFGRVTAMLDKLRDETTGRLSRLGTDASGLLDPQAQEVIDAFSRLHPRPIEMLEPTQARRQPTIADAVQAVLKAQGRLTAAVPLGGMEERIIRSGGAEVPVRIYHPVGAGPSGLPVIVYAHGGGGVLGHPATYDKSSGGLVNKTGAIVVSVDYRRAPEHPFPAAHDDFSIVTRWVMSVANEFGGDVSRVAVVGEGFGANLAASTCLQLNTSRVAKPLLQVLIYPVTTGRQDSESFVDSADAVPLNRPMSSWFAHHIFSTSELPASDRRFALLGVPGSELSGLPPAVVFTADRDPLRSQGEQYAAHLRDAGVRVVAERFTGMPHDFFGMAAVVDQAERAQQLAADELNRAFAAPSPAGLTG